MLGHQEKEGPLKETYEIVLSSLMRVGLLYRPFSSRKTY